MSWKHEQLFEEMVREEIGEQEPPTGIDSAGSENSDAERSSSILSPSPLISGKQHLRPTTGQTWLLSKRKASHKDGQPANTSLRQG